MGRETYAHLLARSDARVRRTTPVLRALLASALVVSLASPASGLVDAPVDGDEAIVLRPDYVPEFDVEVGASGEEYVAGEVIVKFKSGILPETSHGVHVLLGTAAVEPLGAVRGLELARLASGKDVAATVRAYEAMPEVEYAQPNYISRVAAVPNDSMFPMQWGLHNTGQTGGTADADIDAPEAWDVTTGSSDVVIAVVDTGIDRYHPELLGNLWVNPNEILNGLDDDANGYVDDINGADPYYSDGDPQDINGHGTHVAGIIGAQGANAKGTAGTEWDVSLMAVNAGGRYGVFMTSIILRAFSYVKSTDARIINCSFSGSVYQPAIYQAIQEMPDRLFVCAAGNSGQDLEVTKSYPAGYDLPNILSVGSSDANDARSTFSNYGATSVDLFAPGDSVVSTWRCALRRIVAPDATVNTIFYDDFTNLDAWSQTGDHPWVVDTSQFASPSSSAGNIEYGDSQTTTLTVTSPIDISTADFPGMRFKVKIDSATGDSFSWGYYHAETGRYYSYGSVSGGNGEFQELAGTLGMFVGHDDIHPWVRFTTDGATNSADGYGGVWVDDMEVFDIDLGPSGWLWDYGAWVGAYAYRNGTSMSAPHATGVAGLLLARNPTLTSLELKQAIMDGVDTPPTLAGLCVTGGRLNAYGAIVAANRPPGVVEDAFTTPEDTSAAFNVLANDADAEGDPMAAEITRGVSVGTLALSPAGDAKYTPPPNWSGATSFAYRAFDGFAYSESVNATITVTPVNDAPVALGDSYGTIAGGRLAVPSNAGVLGNDTDIDSPALSALLVAPPAHGTLSLDADGGFTYVPAPGFSGIDTFSYAAHDGVVASAPVQVTIRVFALRVSASSTGAAEDDASAAQEATSAGLPPAPATGSDEESASPDDVERTTGERDGRGGYADLLPCGVASAVALLFGLGLAFKRRRKRPDASDTRPFVA